MKKLLLITVTILFIALGVFAQEGLLIGVKGGAGASLFLNKLDSDDPDHVYKARPSGLFSITVQYNFNETVGVGTAFGFTFLRTGTTYDLLSEDDLIITEHANYITIPIYLHVSGDPDNVVNGYFFFGPEFNFLTSVNETDNYTGYEFTKEEKKDYKDEYYKTAVIGAGLGGGIQFNAADSRLKIFLGINIGGTFTDIYSDYEFRSDKRDATFSVRAGGELGVKFLVFEK